jgi:large subunit ribosomal protein L30
MSVIKVVQVRSAIRRSQDQKDTLKALGIKGLNKVVEVKSNPQTIGMIKKVEHLIKIVD